MRAWVLALACTGCSSILGIDDFKLGDGGTTGNEGTGGDYCLGPVGWKVCLAAQPTNMMSITSPTNIDTQTVASCLPVQPPSWQSANQPDACIIVGAQITISAALNVTGARPLVLVAADTITIAGAVDVASHAGGVIGPASPSARCGASGTGGSSTSGAGGAAGGSFMSKGGNGGGGTAAAGTRGIATTEDLQSPTLLRAGCTGALGGAGTEAGGAGGAGGGAIYLLAGNRITINSIVNASGAGGNGGGRAGGGGGGGSGGMIVVHAPTIDGNGGVLMANGGGGGGGGGGNQPGQRGADPPPNIPSNVAVGGSAGSGGGTGGNGFALTTEAGAGVPGAAGAVGGGGGGGGGKGYIRANKTPTQVTTSPAISIVTN